VFVLTVANGWLVLTNEIFVQCARPSQADFPFGLQPSQNLVGDQD
jgi:hypothetical protein